MAPLLLAACLAVSQAAPPSSQATGTTPPGASAAPASDAVTRPPSRQKIVGAVDSYFKTLDRPFNSTDIISLAEVAPMLEEADFTWVSDHAQGLLRRVLPENDYLVRKLRTKSGRQFARRIGATRGAYDRIDRLRDGGTAATDKIIDSRDGYKWILYLASNPKGKTESKWIENSGMPGGEDFAKPTGRVYTKPMLVDALLEIAKEISTPPKRGVR